ncbi:signal transduction histidine kinase [Paenibacillus sp. V4I3]|uniref:sensor histidine kinase n=1 Tax=unclassified Paenibacillus TaxID=185978 RepID=UPI00277DAB30|nr:MULTISPECIES: histidine kinase N-terminal 7TM domain-containing protein [unclassified Paenibacillus]MDQ0875689.1 signal transduction histidine kinase [Paenibacillus sp. V4I3]MDQ0888241.1 signal transduction histidine kinase [Paenibacillus sp. V4I9]
MDTRQWMSVTLFLATALMVFVSFLSYRKRYLPVAKTMVLIMLAAACYAFGYAFEVLSRSLNDVKLSLQIEYLGIPFVTTLWFFQVIQFTGTAARYRKRLALVLFVVPAAVFFLHLTNDWHHLIYERYIRNVSDSVPLYTTVKGPWYKVHTVYNYSVLLCGMLLFIPMYWRALPIVRKQIVILLLGAVAPMVFNLFFWSGMDVDLTPFGFAVSGIAYVWGILRYNFLRLTPLAMAKVFETIRDGVVLFDYEDQIVSYNEAAEKVLPELGLPKRYPIGMEKVLSESPELLKRIRAASDRDERFPFHRFHAHRNKHYNCSLSLIYDSGNVLIGKILMFNDITEMKESEARLRENARQLSELNAFKDKLFTVVAHDIRDPIALLVSLTELLGDELTAADFEHAELVRELKGQVQSTFHLVENLLDWYRSQKGKVVFRPLGWNLQQVVRQALLLSGTKAGMKQIRMTEQINEKLTVRADKEMLDLILRNLLSNAIKFTGIGGAIEIGAVLEGDQIIVSVSDNGAGIDVKTSDLLRLEEPFLKVMVNGDDSEDMRFGLALIREFVRIHGGSLWFESEPGIGTTFSFTLPGSAGVREAFDDGGMEEEVYESDFGGR